VSDTHRNQFLDIGISVVELVETTALVGFFLWWLSLSKPPDSLAFFMVASMLRHAQQPQAQRPSQGQRLLQQASMRILSKKAAEIISSGYLIPKLVVEKKVVS